MDSRDANWPILVRLFSDVWRGCMKYAASVVGGIRTLERNAAVGGAPNSRHQADCGWGAAFDVVTDREEDRDVLAQHLADCGWHVHIGVGYAPTQLHVQAYPPADPRWPL